MARKPVSLGNGNGNGDKNGKVEFTGDIPSWFEEAARLRMEIKEQLAEMKANQDGVNAILLPFLQQADADFVVTHSHIKVSRVRKTSRSLKQDLLTQALIKHGVKPHLISLIVEESTVLTSSEYINVSVVEEV